MLISVVVIIVSELLLLLMLLLHCCPVWFNPCSYTPPNPTESVGPHLNP